MNINNCVVSKKNISYFLFFIFIFVGLLNSTTLVRIDGFPLERYINIIYLLISCILLLLNVLSDKKNKKKWLLLFVVCSLIFINAIYINSYILLTNFLLIIAFKDKVNFLYLNKIYLIVGVFGILATLFFWFINALPDFKMFRYGLDKTVDSLGYRHLNTLPMVLNFLWLAILIQLNKITFSKLVLLTLVTILFLYAMDYFYSRTSIMMLVFNFSLFILLRILNRKLIFNKLIFCLLAILPFLFFLLSYYLITNLNHSDIQIIDKALSYRIYYANLEYQHYGIHLFGERIPKDVDWLVDNYYAVLMIKFGIMNSIIVFGFMFLFLKKIFKYQDKWLLIAWIYIVIFSFSESSAQSLALNYFIFAYCSKLSNRDKSNKISDNYYEYIGPAYN